MAMFVATHHNTVDKKGRVSIPASFRPALARATGQSTVFVWPSMNHAALEGADPAFMEELSESLENPDLDDDVREYMETFIFGKAVELTLDPEGRVVLPKALADHAGISDRASFVGRRKTFQIWNPDQLGEHEKNVLVNAAAKNISISGVMAKGNRAKTNGKGGDQ